MKPEDAVQDIQAMVQQTLLGDAWENAVVAVAVFSDDGRYIACNRAMCALTGYDRDEILQMRVGVDLAQDRVENEVLLRGVVTNERPYGTGALKRKDGSVIQIHFWAIETTAAGLPFYATLYWNVEDPPALA
jgi:PAS domain S-box-containing protein